MDTTSSSATMTDDNKYQLRDRESIKEYIKEKMKIAPKVLIGGHCIIFEIQENESSEFFTRKAKEDLQETPERVAQGIKELKELIAGETDLHIIDTEEFYTIFLRPCKWYAQSAFSLMKRYFRFCQNHPHIYSELLPSKEKAIFCSGLTYPLPLRGKDGCRIFMVEVGKRWKPKQISLNELFRGMMLCAQAAMLELKTQIAGGRIIVDFEGLSLSQVTYFTPSFAKMVVDFIQKALPIRIKTIHIVNEPFIFNMVFAFFKPLLEEKLRKRIHFHGTNRESLMVFIDKSVLLKRHGGELDAPDASFGMSLWQYFCTFEELFVVQKKIGYTNKN